MRKRTYFLPFCFFILLTAITILNDKLAFFNIVFSGIYVLLCAYYAAKVVPKSRPLLYILSFSILYLIYALISPEFHGSLNSKWGMLNWELKVMLTIFPAYYFGKYCHLTERYYRMLVIVFFVVGVISYYLNIDMILANREYDDDGLTNNVGYLFAAMLPLMLINVKKNWLFIFLTYIFILAGLKRGAIICGVMTVPFLMYVSRRNFRISKKVIISVVLILSFVVGHYVHKAVTENEYVARRVELTMEGDSSGRDRFADQVWSAVQKFDTAEITFGKGINYNMVIIGNYVHNDWLELLTSLGIVGCLFYLLTFFGSYLLVKNECEKKWRCIGYLILILMFFRTVVSMNYFSLDAIPLYFTLGLLCTKNKRYVQNCSLHSNIQ